MKLLKLLPILFISFIVSTQNILALDPTDLAGSISSIKTEVKYFLGKKTQDRPDSEYLISPILGAKLWESGVICNFYKLLDNNDSIGALTKLLFHENQGVFLESNRTISEYLDVELIGQLIGFFLKYDNIEIKIQKNGFKYYFKNKEITKLVQNLKDKVIGKVKNKTSKKKLREIKRQFNKVIHCIINSFKNKNNIFYDKYSAIFVLEALAYRKMNSKDDLITYFEGISEGFNNKDENEEINIFNIININTLKNATFDISKIQNILNDETGESFNPNQIIPKKVEDFLISQILINYISDLPNIVTYKGNVKYGKALYPDCMETTIRNLINIILFENGRFDTNSFKIKGELNYFYTKTTNPTNITNQDVHDSWSELINNKHFVPYHRIAIIEKENKSINTINPVIKVKNLGYFNDKQIKLNDFKITLSSKEYALKKIQINDLKYIIIDTSDDKLKELVCYEVYPSAEAIVSILGHVFDFDDLEIDLEKDFFSKKFLNKLHNILEELHISINNVNIDLQKSFTLQLSKNIQNRFAIKIKRGRHGEIPIDSIKKQDINYYNKNLNLNNKNSYSFVALSGIEIDINQIDDNNLLQINLKSSFIKLKLIKSFLSKNLNSKYLNKLISTLSFIPNYEFIKQIKKLISESNNNNLYKKAIEISKEAFEFNDNIIKKASLKLFKALFKKGQAFDEAIKVASIGIIDTNYYVRRKSIKLFIALVEKNQAFDEAIKVTSIGLIDPNYSIRRKSIKLFIALVKKNQAFGEAIKAAYIGIIDTMDDGVRKNSIKLFIALFEKDQGFKEAIEAASIGIENEYWLTRCESIKLFIALVEKNKGFEEAIKAASTGIHDKDSDVRESSLELFKLLFEKDQGFNEAKVLNNDKLNKLLEKYKKQ